MGAFWDARARENAPFFVESRLDYADPDLAAFWASGEEAVAALERELGFEIGCGEQVVEIGCGIGRLTRVLTQRSVQVRALDVSAEMLARAEALHTSASTDGEVRWLLGDGHSLAGIEDASADGVLSHVVFQHLPDPELTYGYVAEIGRVLRPGGWAAFQVSTDPTVHRPRRRLGARVRAAARRGPRGTAHPAWLGCAVDLERLLAVGKDNGMGLAAASGAGTQFTLLRLVKRG